MSKICRHCKCKQSEGHYFRPYDGCVCAECRRRQIRQNRRDRNALNPRRSSRQTRAEVCGSVEEFAPRLARAQRLPQNHRDPIYVPRNISWIKPPYNPDCEEMYRARRRIAARNERVKSAIELAQSRGLTLREALKIEGVI